MNIKYFLIAGVALLAVACSGDSDGDSKLATGSEPVLLCVGDVSGMRAVNNADDLLQDGRLTAGKQITVQLTDKGTSPVSYAPVLYTVGTYDSQTNLSPLTPASTQYFPTGSDIKAYAYYPHNASATFTVAANQDQTATGVANYLASDLMYASNNALTRGIANTLEFHHLMSKIVVILKPDDGFSSTDLATTTVTLGTTATGEGIITAATFDKTTGTLTAGSTREQMTLTTSTSTDVKNAAIVVPQNMEGKKINVTMEGFGTLSYVIADDTTFEPGKEYTYTITVMKKALSVTATISNWSGADDPAIPGIGIWQ